jgi:hypothetical protein
MNKTADFAPKMTTFVGEFTCGLCFSKPLICHCFGKVSYLNLVDVRKNGTMIHKKSFITPEIWRNGDHLLTQLFNQITTFDYHKWTTSRLSYLRYTVGVKFVQVKINKTNNVLISLHNALSCIHLLRYLFLDSKYFF